MQKDIQTSKGQQKSDITSTTEKVSDTAGHKMKQVGHDINAGLKENVGVGVGNYSSNVDRMESKKHEGKFEEKKEELKEENEERKKRLEKEKRLKEFDNKKKEKQNFEETGMIGHKAQEIGHNVNATLKQNVGFGVGNYPSNVDRKMAQEHQGKYEEKKEDQKQKLEEKKEQVKDNYEEKKGEVKEFIDEKTEVAKEKYGEVKDYLNEKTEVAKEKYGEVKEYLNEKTEVVQEKLGEVKEKIDEKIEQVQTSIYGEKAQELGHSINAKLKENLGVGIGDYPSEVDKKKEEEHREKYMEKVKEETNNTEVSDSRPIVHKIKEVAHTVNASMKEMIGVGVGNYSSEVDRELIDIHHKKYEEKTQEFEKEEKLPEKKPSNENKL